MKAEGAPTFDDERSVVAEVRGDVLEAPHLVVLRQHVEERVEHDIDQPVRADRRRRRHVPQRHGDRIAAGLLTQLCDHRHGEVDAVDRHAGGRERQRDAAGADRELECRPCPRGPARNATVASSSPRSTERVVLRRGRLVERHHRLVSVHAADATRRVGRLQSKFSGPQDRHATGDRARRARRVRRRSAGRGRPTRARRP